MASRRGTAVSLLPRSTARASDGRARHLHVDVLDGHRRLVDQHADGQGQAAQRHDVDRVAGQPQRQQRAEQGHRDVEDHHDHAAPVAQEQQDHQAGQRGADQALRAHAADGRAPPSAIRRTRSGSSTPSGSTLLKRRHGAVDVGHHGQGRGGVLLDDRDVDRALAVDQGVAEVDVGAVGDRGHVADVDVAARLHGDLADLLRMSTTMALVGTSGIWSLMYRLPAGTMTLPAVSALTTSSGVRL